MAARRPSIFVFVEDRPPAIAAQSGRQHIRDYIARLACSLALADINVTHMPLVRPKRRCAGRQNRLIRSRKTQTGHRPNGGVGQRRGVQFRTDAALSSGVWFVLS
jgi:hypothetical protein